MYEQVWCKPEQFASGEKKNTHCSKVESGEQRGKISDFRDSVYMKEFHDLWAGD